MFTHFQAIRFSRNLLFNGICCFFLAGLAPTDSDAASLTRISGSGVVEGILLGTDGPVKLGDALQFSLVLDEDLIGRDANSLPTGSRHQIDDAIFTLNIGEAKFSSIALIDIFLAVDTQRIIVSNLTLSGNFDPVLFDSFSLFIDNESSLFSDDSLVGGLQALADAEASDFAGSLNLNGAGAFSALEQQFIGGGVSINVERNVSTVPVPAAGLLFASALGMLWRFSRRQQT